MLDRPICFLNARKAPVLGDGRARVGDMDDSAAHSRADIERALKGLAAAGLAIWPQENAALEVARQKLQISQFKPLQREILAAIAAKHDVAAVLPPGYGKSALFQIPMLCSTKLYACT